MGYGQEHKTRENDELIRVILAFYMNMFGSDEYNTKYLLSNDVLPQLISVLEWNSPESPIYNDRIEFTLMAIFNNLVASNAFDHGRPLIDGGC